MSAARPGQGAGVFPGAGGELGPGLLALLVLGVLDALSWAGAAASTLLTRHRLPDGDALSGLRALLHPGDPGVAYAGGTGPPLSYWLFALLAAVVLGVLVWAVRRLQGWAGAARPAARSREGFATRAEVAEVAGRRALSSRAQALRPTVRRPRPSDLGYLLGHSRGVACYASVEDSILLLGPPRSGKGTSLVVPMILEAPGALVTTSTRPDNLAVTLEERARRGPVALFDPQGLAPGAARHVSRTWSLTRGCEVPQTAMTRAGALVGEAGRTGVENGTFWRQQALSATRCLLHAAALDNRPPSHLYRWSHAAGGAKEAVEILATHPHATPGWERALDAIVSAEQRTRDAIWAMVANAFSPLADPAVLAAVSPAERRSLDPLELLRANGSIYLLGTASGASATASLVAALVEDLVEAARRLGAGSANQRLDPPLALVLDEAANYPLASLAALVSEGGGSGITTLVVLQSLSQARDRFGKEAAGAIWDSAVAKIVLGGSANAEDLADLSALLGEREVTEWSETRHGGSGGRSLSSSRRSRPVLEPAEIRRMPIGTGLLLLRAAPPILAELTPWTKRKDAKRLVAARRRFEEAVTPTASLTTGEEEDQ